MWMERAEDRERCETRLAQMRRRAELRQLPKPLLPPQDVMDLCEPVEGTAILTENVLGQWQGVLEALTPTERKALHQDPSAAISPAASNRPAVALSAPRRDSNCPSASASATRRQRPAGSPLAFTSVEIQFPAGRPDAAADPRRSRSRHSHVPGPLSNICGAFSSFFWGDDSPHATPTATGCVFPATPGHLTQAVPLTPRDFVARGTPSRPARCGRPAPRLVQEGGRIILSDTVMMAKASGTSPVGLGPMGSSLGGLSSASSLAFPSASPSDGAAPPFPAAASSGTFGSSTSSGPLDAKALHRHLKEADRRIRPTFRFREAEELYGCAAYLRTPLEEVQTEERDAPNTLQP